MKKSIRRKGVVVRHAVCVTTTIILASANGCRPVGPVSMRDPAAEYASRVRGEEWSSIPRLSPHEANVQPHVRPAPKISNVSFDESDPRARVSLAAEEKEFSIDAPPPPATKPVIPPVRDYNGPLSVGDPGVSASLWRESKGILNDMFHDYRAWKPMDLITVRIQEQAQGNKQANTRVNTKSTFEAAIADLIGIEETIANKNPGITPSSVLNAETETEFTGQGQTIRQDRLTGTISAMVAEVLPSGILRVEGEKIVTVNGEEQNMRITGLVRPRDINSNNEVISSQIANMRIDYYGKGTLGDSQSPGWLARFLGIIWPF